MMSGCPCCEPGSYCGGLCSTPPTNEYVITVAGIADLAPPGCSSCANLNGDFTVTLVEDGGICGLLCDAVTVVEIPETDPPVEPPEPCAAELGCCWAYFFDECGFPCSITLSLGRKADCYVWVSISLVIGSSPGTCVTLEKRLDFPPDDCKADLDGLAINIASADGGEYTIDATNGCDILGISFTVNEV